MEYDSEADTREHIRQVGARLEKVCTELRDRGYFHDASKLGPNEKPYFDAATPKLKDLKFGSDEYRECLREIRPAIDHHNAHNSHHPEFYANGVAGMDLLDLVEMYCDWAAATLRNPGGVLGKSIDYCSERFGMGDVLTSIFRNTFRRHGGFCGYENYHLYGHEPADDGTWTTEVSIGTGQVFRRQPKANKPILAPRDTDIELAIAQIALPAA